MPEGPGKGWALTNAFLKPIQPLKLDIDRSADIDMKAMMNCTVAANIIQGGARQTASEGKIFRHAGNQLTRATCFANLGRLNEV